LDTRQKIVDLTEARARLAAGRWIVLTGIFDPLTLTQAKRVHAARETGCKLAALVLDCEDALLPVAARAALVAALRDVDLVTTARDSEWQTGIANTSNIHLIDDAEGERARSAEFVRMVVERQRSA
jgi:hypothetical protein